MEGTPLDSVDDAKAFIKKSFTRELEKLWISDALDDEMGMNMAVIGDELLQNGYMPNGFEQKEGYKIYQYKKQSFEDL